ncbi:CO(2)-response secreted protease-like [Magnolia sinica]|uniref:CO(2)-response secreted protease-like n=1 Tax=Magnolia sinica TaxID=86752 RepID=UPI00265B5CA9|nr:CO(2)-response secreted protease-like [Magnolia sinica]
MASLFHFLSLTLSFLLPLHANAIQSPKAYVVYMGSSTNTNGEADHLQMLSSIIPSHDSERLSLIHSYNHAFMGFSAMLTDKEAAVLSDRAGVVSVFPDPVLQLHTTRSWDFLEGGPAGVLLKHGHLPVSGDVIVGVIDTGIWPESPSFDDMGIGAIPSRWKGICMEGSDFKKSDCNRKLIGARYYNSQVGQAQYKKPVGSPRDAVGHGTHTASTAVGAPVHNASYYGLAQGVARGGAPASRLAVYQACSLGGCSGSTILKAIEDAIKDGVDIISISIGISSIFQSDFLSDPIAIGAFHASQMGVMVVCSGGNDGPDPFTVVNSAPWIFTVAASNIDRDFESSIVLGNGVVYKGSAINFSNLTRSKSYPLSYGRDVAAKSVPESEASNCEPGSLDPNKAAGKIIVCVDSDQTVPRRVKRLVADAARAKGLILIDEAEKMVPFDSSDFPLSEVGDFDGYRILKYMNSTKNPTATILPTTVVSAVKPAPVVASFSSRGPGALTETILKPDVTAPGVAILASTIPATDGIPAGKKGSTFGIRSGTSMACPHVTGAAAYLKSVHPNWTSSMIKSALMTTATLSNNRGRPLTNSTGAYANPHEMGAGQINPIRAIDPGLVFETTTKDYLYFLCYYGYKAPLIKSISGTNFTCPSPSSEDLISNLNYPSISINTIYGQGPPVAVTRTATNVGHVNSTYVARISAPPELVVKVSPQRLVFSEWSTKVSFDVMFGSNGTKKGYMYGSVIWSDGAHLVRTVFAVNIV